MSFIATVITYADHDSKHYIAGVSETFEEACKKIIKKCVDLNRISYESYCVCCEDNDEQPLSQEEFVKMLCDKPLLKALHEYNDSWYLQTWNVAIFKLVQGEYEECNLKDGELLEKNEIKNDYDSSESENEESESDEEYNDEEEVEEVEEEAEEPKEW